MISDDIGKPPAFISVDIAVYDDGNRTDYKHAKSVNLKKANPGEFTPDTVIRMFVNGARTVKNIKLAVVESPSVVITSSGTQNADGSMPHGTVGVSHSVSPTVTVSSYFKGINTTGRPDDTNNISIANGTKNNSEYVALNVKVPDSIQEGYLAYRWFFDFVE